MGWQCKEMGILVGEDTYRNSVIELKNTNRSMHIIISKLEKS